MDCGGDTCTACKARCIDHCQEIGDPCNENDDCTSDYCDQSDSICAIAPVPTSCSEATAIDLGYTGEETTIQNDGCVMVRDDYPEWWGTRTMLLQTTSPGVYPAGFTWSNACTGNGGSEMFSSDWENKFLSQTSDMCATLIDFSGSGSGTITVRYQGN